MHRSFSGNEPVWTAEDFTLIEVSPIEFLQKDWNFAHIWEDRLGNTLPVTARGEELLESLVALIRRRTDPVE